MSLLKKKLAFMAVVNKVKGFVRSVVGIPPLTLPNAVGEDLLDYKVYGNSKQNGTPTPEAPVVIESVGDKTRNLWYPSVDTLTNNGVTATRNPDNTFSVSGTATAQAWLHLGKVSVEAGITHYLSGGTPNVEIAFQCRQGSTGLGTVFNNGGVSVEDSYLVNDTDTINVVIAVNSGVTVNDVIVKPMISLENTNVYESYGYKVPIKVIGKNLYDAETHFNAVYEAETMASHKPSKGVVDGVECYQYWGRNFSLEYPENVLYIKGIFKENTQYTISLDRYDIFGSNGYPGVNVQVYYTDGTYKYTSVATVGVDLEKTWRHNAFTTAVNKTVNHIYFGFSTGAAQTYFANMQIEEGTTETTYEPYKDLDTTNIYLNEPLRKAVDIADYIHSKNGKVVRALDCLTFDGTEDWRATAEIIYMPLPTTASGDYVYGFGNNSISTHLKNPVDTKADGELFFSPVGSVLRIHKMNGTYTDVEGWKAFLAEEYAKGTPMQLITPYITPTEEAIALPPIPTAKGTTTLIADVTTQPSNMDVTYYSSI